MSTIVTVYIPDGIVMAADSRIIRKDSSPPETVSDNGQKLFLLHDKVGVSFCGDADIEGKRIREIISDFDKGYVYERKKGKEIIADLSDHLKKAVGKCDSCFHLAVYDEKEYVYLLEDQELRQVNTDGYGVTWSGDITYLKKLINDDPKLEFDFADYYLKDGIDLCRFMIETNMAVQHFSTLTENTGGPIDILWLNKDRAGWVQHKIYGGETDI